jgi:hypothetical protein
MINLTQHPATAAQGNMAAQAADDSAIKALLNIEPGESGLDIAQRVQSLCDWVQSVDDDDKTVMVGGHLYLTMSLTARLVSLGYTVVMAESRRESVETTGPDGSVTKRNVFKHCGWRVIGAPDVDQIKGIRVGSFHETITRG